MTDSANPSPLPTPALSRQRLRNITRRLLQDTISNQSAGIIRKERRQLVRCMAKMMHRANNKVALSNIDIALRNEYNTFRDRYVN